MYPSLLFNVNYLSFKMWSLNNFISTCNDVNLRKTALPERSVGRHEMFAKRLMFALLFN